MILAAALLIIGAIIFTLFIRTKDIPPAEPESPVAHLEERKARIYEGLRDLQFEYRVGKLSETDYQQTKLGLQKELARVMGEIDSILGKQPRPAPPAAAKKVEVPQPAPAALNTCPHCGATFQGSAQVLRRMWQVDDRSLGMIARLFAYMLLASAAFGAVDGVVMNGTTGTPRRTCRLRCSSSAQAAWSQWKR